MPFLQELIGSKGDAFKDATQSPFLHHAARGQVPKDILGEWLANDRLYIHAYIRGVGRLLSHLELPESTGKSHASSAMGLLDWCIEALANVRREERFFIDTASKFGIAVDLPVSDNGKVPDDAKLPGLQQFERLFGNIQQGGVGGDVLPWLEAAVLFWGTEKCYLEAWSWAASQVQRDQDGTDDMDGGALRNEFIPNWSSDEFADFVNALGAIINKAVEEYLADDSNAKGDLLARAQIVWEDLLEAEKMFWPPMR